MNTHQDTDPNPKLQLYAGTWGGLIPLCVLVAGLVWLSLAERGGTRPFWACAWIALVTGLFCAKDKTEYCRAALRGLGDNAGVVIIAAWLFAGVFGKLMAAGGLVDGLLWLGMTTGAKGSAFTLCAFLAAMTFALGTGTSTGTCIALTPVLYPAGYFLGADPVFLGLAILSGAAFGDNLAPISDTTIVSAYTQEASMRDVVRSRFPLAMAAAIISGCVFLVLGGGGQTDKLTDIAQTLRPHGIFMLLALVVVVVSALRGRHIVESLIYGNITAAAVGLITGGIGIKAIFSIPGERGMSTGLIEDGIQSTVGAIIFALLILAVTRILIESGVMSEILSKAEKFIAQSVRQAEFFIVGVTIAASIPLSANAPAELLVGPSLVRPVGKRFGLAPARSANLMDCAVCTIFFILPWHIAVAVWYGAISAACELHGIPAPPVSAALYNPYSWALLAVLLFSIVTGWNRRFATEKNSTENRPL